jgi:hypothetical protein
MNELDEQLDRELRELPGPRAPETLLPRVMLAVAEADAKPWYARAWMTWPREVQVASALLLALVVAGLWSIAPIGFQGIADVVSPAANDIWTRLAAVVRQTEQVATLGRVLWEVLLGPIAAHALVFTVLIAFFCALFWTAVTRLALGEAASQ